MTESTNNPPPQEANNNDIEKQLHDTTSAPSSESSQPPDVLEGKPTPAENEEDAPSREMTQSQSTLPYNKFSDADEDWISGEDLFSGDDML